MTREDVRKGPAAEAERDASQYAVGGIAQVSFFSSYSFINSSSFFLRLCLDQWTQHDQNYFMVRHMFC